MTIEISPEATPSAAQACEAPGQAALLLVESLLHGLIANDALSVAQAIDIVDIARDAGAELTSETNTIARPRTVGGILGDISASLTHDLPDDGVEAETREADRGP